MLFTLYITRCNTMRYTFFSLKNIGAWGLGFILLLPGLSIGETIRLGSSFDHINPGKFFEFIEDKENIFTFGDISGEAVENLWTRSEKDGLGFGFTRSTIWVRFRIKNISNETLSMVLEEMHPVVDYLSLFIPEKNNDYREIKIGDRYPFSQRPILHKRLAFPLTLSPHAEGLYYLKYASQGSINVSTTIRTTASFYKQKTKEDLVHALFGGIIIAMVFYNFMLYLFIRMISYLHYTLFMLFMLILQMTQLGTAYQFLWPNHPIWTNYCIPIVISGTIFFAITFCRSFLQTKRYDPKMHRITTLCLWSLLPLFVISLMTEPFETYIYAYKTGAIYAIVSTLTCLFCGIRLMGKNHRSAYQYVAAWLVLLSGTILYALMAMGFVAENFWIQQFWTIGLTCMALIFSSAQADKMNIMRKGLQSLSENLDLKVRERTAALESAMQNLEITNSTLSKTKNALWGEMQLAKKIQSVLLPKSPSIEGYDIAVYSQPTEEVGGDYYDIITVEGYDWIVIGDVSGHGVSAGLIMMMAQAAIHTVLWGNPDINPSKLITLVNKTLSENIIHIGGNHYMTMTILAGKKENWFHFSGLHQDIMIYRKQKKTVEVIETQGMWLGIVTDLSEMTHEHSFYMAPGDVLLLYTDGLTEATQTIKGQEPIGTQAAMFGENRLTQLLLEYGEAPVDDIKKNILKSLETFSLKDDVTLVIAKRRSVATS